VTDALTRIADALDRLAPPPLASSDPLAHKAYVWDGAHLAAATRFAPVPIDLLTGIDAQRDALVENLRRLERGHAAHDVLLWGARGTGKSALAASVAATAGDMLALVEVTTAGLDTLPRLFDQLAPVARAFAILVDDIAFSAPSEARSLRSLLEGGADARPANMRLIVTSNRRHLVKRDIAEQASAINPRDDADDALALADRFGLSLGFHAVEQDSFLAIVRRYADAHCLPFDAPDAIRWATQRGSRSGRVAWQYVVDLAGRHDKALDRSRR
jgi:hypothetical protein